MGMGNEIYRGVKGGTLWSEPLKEGPVLALDIDGVCVPIRNKRKPRTYGDLSPPGFFSCPQNVLMSGHPHWHPKLKGWFEELDGAYAHVAWASSWIGNCWKLGAACGSETAASWKLMSKVGGWNRHGEKPFYVAPDVPFATIDDQHGAEEGEAEWFSQRTAPTLVLAPAPDIGLGRALVDLLIAFAKDPWSEQFKPWGCWRFYEHDSLEWRGPTDDPDGWPAEAGGLVRMEPDPVEES